MPRKTSLLHKLQNDLPQFSFSPDKGYRWSSATQTIFYPVAHSNDADLLHEVGHALSNHFVYHQDIELLQMEREAWTYAQSLLAPKYNVSITEDIIEDALDTYREWLYARSACPQCHQTGLHTKTGTYQCLNCKCQWRANDARVCLLRRYKI